MEKRHEKLNDSIQVNFNNSKEISYWANRFNISAEAFRKIFAENGYSISKTLSYCNINYTTVS